MDIDPDICNWILEFLFRQPLEDRILNSLLRAVSLPKENPKLAKSLLLKKLDSELSQHSVSESTLDLLEQLEEIESRQGNLPVSDAMKRAYCAVAVHCTLKPFVTRDDGDDDHDARKFRFFEAVKRLWRGRIGLMEKGVGRGGLGSDLLWEWKDDIEAAVWDDVVCKSIVKKFEGVDANKAIRVYVREEWEKMGPSFLQLVAERVKNDDGFLKNLVAGNQDRVARAGVDGSNATKVDFESIRPPTMEGLDVLLAVKKKHLSREPEENGSPKVQSPAAGWFSSSNSAKKVSLNSVTSIVDGLKKLMDLMREVFLGTLLLFKQTCRSVA